MARDHRKLRVFKRADDLILELYREMAQFPHSERFGLQSQIRRAGVSVAVNLVEGCARRSDSEYCRFVDIAFASSRELHYLITVAARLGFLDSQTATTLAKTADVLCAELMQLQKSLEAIIQRSERTDA